MVIREAVEADAEEIARVRHASVHHFGPSAYSAEVVDAWAKRDPEWFIAALRAGEPCFVAAAEGSEIVGYSFYRVKDGNHRTGVYVSGSAGGRGIGSALLERAIEAARANGAKEIRIDASLNAVRLYERHGFARVGVEEHRFGDGAMATTVHMVRRIAKEQPTAIAIRPLCESDWSDLRELRLRALRTEPGVFCARYAEERERPEIEWRALASNADDRRRVFGLFDATTLIGITAVFPDRDDPRAQTAVFAMSYIEPLYRRRGLTRLLYEARLAWARSTSTFRTIRVSHRRSNEASRRAILHHGFHEVGVVAKTWPDGAHEDEILYELRLP